VSCPTAKTGARTNVMEASHILSFERIIDLLKKPQIIRPYSNDQGKWKAKTIARAGRTHPCGIWM
jgi:hypothetical protein